MADELLRALGFEEPDKDIPKEDLVLLERTFEAVELGFEIPQGVEITEKGVKLPNGRVYRCLAVGWKRIEG